MLVEVGKTRVLLDPGNYNEAPDVEEIDALLLTHEHADHCHIESVKTVLEKNPRMRVITHQGVGKILDDAGIPYELIGDGDRTDVSGVSVQSFGSTHACIHDDLPPVQNTGFLLDEKFFYPGDALHDPGKLVEILALPIAGPWVKLGEAIEYAKAIKPKFVFPVHDGMLRQSDPYFTPTRRIPKLLLEPLGIEYIDMTEGSVHEF